MPRPAPARLVFSALLLLAPAAAPAEPAPLADFEPGSGYAPGELVGQPSFSGATVWSRTGVSRVAAVVGAGESDEAGASHWIELLPDARPFDTVRYRPVATELGLADESRPAARLRFALRLRLPDLDPNDDRITHVLSLFRDTQGPHKGRAVRLHLHRNGRVTLANTGAALGVLRDADTWTELSGVADFSARLVTLRLGDAVALGEVPFVSEGGEGLDDYGCVEFGSALAGVRVWIDELDLAVER